MMPSLSTRASDMIRLEKAGIDVTPRLLSAILDNTAAVANVNKYTFNNDRDAKLAFNPMHYLFTVITNNMGTYKTQYKEWRLK